MRIIGAGDDAIAMRAGVTVGARDPYGVLIRQIGTARLFGFWHVGKNLVTSSGNLVTWDDVRGPSGFGPTLLPNGGAGGTGPTVSGGTVNTDGANSWTTHATATSLLSPTNTALTIVWWGEALGTSSPQWGGLVDSPTTGYQVTSWRSASGATLLTTDRQPSANTLLALPKANPAVGTRSLFIAGRNTRYPWDGSSHYTPRADFVGRGIATATGSQAGENNETAGFVCFGRSGPNFGQIKLRGCICIFGTPTATERAAIEAFVTDPSIGDAVNLYGGSDSTGQVLCIGDSITYGTNATSTSQTTPVLATATSYPSQLQSLINGASKSIDVVNIGLPSALVHDFVTVQSGQAATYIDDWGGYLSPARRAAGFKEVVVLFMGTNDIGLASRTAAQVEADLTTAVKIIRAAGGRIALCTILPRHSFYTTTNETARLAVNTWLRANTAGADAVIDMAATQDGAAFPFADPISGNGSTDNVTSNTTYYGADGIHLSDTGYAKLAGRVYAVLNSASLI